MRTRRVAGRIWKNRTRRWDGVKKMNLRVFGGEIERIEPKRPRPIVTVSMLSLKNRGCIVNCNLPETVDLIKVHHEGVL